MNIKRSHLAYAFGTLAMGATLLFTGPMGTFADPLDPATQPHLKSWSNKIPAAKRFVKLADFNNEAILDRETGLVWEQRPTLATHTLISAISCLVS